MNARSWRDQTCNIFGNDGIRSNKNSCDIWFIIQAVKSPWNFEIKYFLTSIWMLMLMIMNLQSDKQISQVVDKVGLDAGHVLSKRR